MTVKDDIFKIDFRQEMARLGISPCQCTINPDESLTNVNYPLVDRAKILMYRQAAKGETITLREAKIRIMKMMKEVSNGN